MKVIRRATLLKPHIEVKILENTFVGFGGMFLQAPKSIKKTSLPKSIKISKDQSLNAKGFNLYAFLMPLGPQFSINFLDRLNLLICNNYIAKASFFHFQASHFGIPNP